jgi:hypothetical protein
LVEIRSAYLLSLKEREDLESACRSAYRALEKGVMEIDVDLPVGDLASGAARCAISRALWDADRNNSGAVLRPAADMNPAPEFSGAQYEHAPEEPAFGSSWR